MIVQHHAGFATILKRPCHLEYVFHSRGDPQHCFRLSRTTVRFPVPASRPMTRTNAWLSRLVPSPKIRHFSNHPSKQEFSTNCWNSKQRSIAWAVANHMDLWELLREFNRLNRVIQAFWPQYQRDLISFLLQGVIRTVVASQGS